MVKNTGVHLNSKFGDSLEGSNLIRNDVTTTNDALEMLIRLLIHNNCYIIIINVQLLVRGCSLNSREIFNYKSRLCCIECLLIISNFKNGSVKRNDSMLHSYLFNKR